MTRATLLLAALVAAVAAVGAVVWLALPGAEDEILVPLRELARAAAVDAGEPQPMGAERGARLAAFFTAEAAVDLGPPFAPVAGRAALSAAAAVLRVPAGGLRIALRDAEASVDRRLLLANATVTAQATPAGNGGAMGERTYAVALRQRDGAWLIHDVRPADSPE